ncbi:class I fructose-bisphosphate aldolase [Pseudomonas typographi]|uniref:class I fructose-bisphosphate aldolase n=1 Tax=Pseudomonas typographi TaxID=2715964 RepID=UPI001686AD2C|nr:class I fructose-bisphosphate aldolase [Pseudomonas typographi]MBD1553546.1 fructose-bisphosphate aldolase class I [Pseudomonas typographi]MBD1587307.1 fructose-bisphosphate aldolase class I [Pseudomonas typographi]
MNTQALLDITHALVADDKGLLAMDESSSTCRKRFVEQGIDDTEPMRRAYRELLITAPRLGDSVSGLILFDETIHQAKQDGTPFVELIRQAGMIPGIKVDLGAKPLAGHPGETITEGLDGLRERLEGYYTLGARFAKWRGVIHIGRNTPSDTAIAVNAHALARYAALCQETGLVPIVEPEVLMDGDHSLARCAEVTERTLHAVFAELTAQGVLLEGMLLKPNMVTSGADSSEQAGVEAVAEATLAALLRCVPAAVPGIAFLSGGQTPELASAHLNAMHQGRPLPWALTFSYGRALQQPALTAWNGEPANVEAAQQALSQRAAYNRAACQGTYREG